MSHINVKLPPHEEARSDLAAEKLAVVVHLVIRKVVERSIDRLNSLKSTSIDAPIFKSTITSKLKKD